MSSVGGSTPSNLPSRRRAGAGGAGWRLGATGAVVLFEILLVAGLYQLAANLDCPDTGAIGLCIFLRSLVGRALAVGALLVVFVPARRQAFGFLMTPRPGRRAWPWAALHLAGVALILAPLFGDAADFARMFAASLGLWLGGIGLATAGLVLWLAPLSAWAEGLRREGRLIAALVAVGFVLPDFAGLLDRLWLWSPLTDATFDLVAMTLRLFDTDLLIDKPSYLMGVGDFVVEVGPACAGYQGMALVCLLLGAYFWLYRAELRFPRALILLPLGIAASFLLNVLRIAVLIRIGAHIDPDLAVNGFHSHAGWLLFTLLAFALIWAGQTIAFFRAVRPVAAPAGPSLRSDPLAALILPFTVFMATGLVANTFIATPGLAYPLRMAATGLALAAFAPLYRRLEWRFDPIAASAGLVLGALWLATAPGASAQDDRLAAALAELPAPVLIGWATARILGTAVVAPLVEELFFRGYLLLRFDRPGLQRILALAGSAAAFALLHDRWLAGLLAGIVFGLIALRRGRVGDAILSHALANGVIAAGALLNSDWSSI